MGEWLPLLLVPLVDRVACRWRILPCIRAGLLLLLSGFWRDSLRNRYQLRYYAILGTEAPRTPESCTVGGSHRPPPRPNASCE
jgi:hypothetical protein